MPRSKEIKRLEEGHLVRTPWMHGCARLVYESERRLVAAASTPATQPSTRWMQMQ
jgi:hypothetical protein